MLHHIFGAVIWELKVVDACHDTRQVVVRPQRWLMGLPYDCQWWVETAEAYGCPISFCSIM